MAEMTYIQAISDALRLEMRRDPRVFLLGEDVGVYGGALKVSLGFQEELGPWRVVDRTLPLPETGELVRSHPGPQDRVPGHTARSEGSPGGGYRGPEPGPL